MEGVGCILNINLHREGSKYITGESFFFFFFLGGGGRRCGGAGWRAGCGCVY